jgi:hypothetical protein
MASSLLTRIRKLFGAPCTSGPVVFGPASLTSHEAFQHLLAIGAPGTGKTSGIVYPLIESFNRAFGPKGCGTFWGGLSIEDREDYCDFIIWAVQQSGRRPSADVIRMNPNPVPLVRLQDMDNGHIFLVAARKVWMRNEGSVLAACVCPAGKITLPKEVFSGDLENYLPLLKSDEVWFDVAGKDLNYLGWRRDQGGLYWALEHHQNRAAYHSNRSAEKRRIPDPQRLRFLGLTQVDANVRYNLINQQWSPAEVAQSLCLAALTDGPSRDSFFRDAFQRYCENIIALLQVLNPTHEHTIADLVHLATDKRAFFDALSKLEDEISMQHAMVGQGGLDQKEAGKPVPSDVQAYFSNTWMACPEALQAEVTALVESAFGRIVKDATLRRTFCAPSSLDIGESVSRGAIFCLSGLGEGAEVIKTMLKFEFQRNVINQAQNVQQNKLRPQLLIVEPACRLATWTSGCSDNAVSNLSHLAKCTTLSIDTSTKSLAQRLDPARVEAWLRSHRSLAAFRPDDAETAQTLTERFSQEKGTLPSPQCFAELGEHQAFLLKPVAGSCRVNVELHASGALTRASEVESAVRRFEQEVVEAMIGEADCWEILSHRE